MIGSESVDAMMFAAIDQIRQLLGGKAIVSIVARNPEVPEDEAVWTDDEAGEVEATVQRCIARSKEGDEAQKIVPMPPRESA